MLDITDTFTQKRGLLEVYGSQLKPLHVRGIEVHADRLGRSHGKFERIWCKQSLNRHMLKKNGTKAINSVNSLLREDSVPDMVRKREVRQSRHT
jgi:hypothetical protein